MPQDVVGDTGTQLGIMSGDKLVKWLEGLGHLLFVK